MRIHYTHRTDGEKLERCPIIINEQQVGCLIQKGSKFACDINTISIEAKKSIEFN